MSFLEDFDKRAQNSQAPRDDAGIPKEDRELLDFADLIRARKALPTPDERARVLERIRTVRATQPHHSGHIWRWVLSAAALVLIAVGMHKVSRLRFFHGANVNSGAEVAAHNPSTAPSAGDIRDDFSGADFPRPTAVAAVTRDAAEKPAGDTARALRVHGLVVVRALNEKRWHVLSRGMAVSPGDTVRASARLESGARVLAPDGSAISIGPGGIVSYTSARAWNVETAGAYFEVSSHKEFAAFAVTTPDGKVSATGTRFGVSVSPRDVNEPNKNATRCWVDEGSVSVASRDKTQTLTTGQSAFVSLSGILTSDKAEPLAWMAALENEMNSDHGIGQLVAKTDKANEHQALEIKSHTVTVTCVDQVARTFVDMVFVNNSDRELEGTFYYPLPSEAAIGEFAMYVGDKRIVGEVLEQQKARQVFEYIVRQQKDPALLEWAGGNLFKMRVYPIPAHSDKRVQLGYTQILPRIDGKVTYTYPLYSEMLLKNPLQELNIEFRVQSGSGIQKLESPTHACSQAVSPDSLRGTLAFSAKNYSPSRDFSATFRLPDSAECVAVANAHTDEKDPYFMLTLAPKVTLPPAKAPERLLVIVDGSATANVQDYAVASEFAASCADVSGNWQIALLRGGQNPYSIDTQMTRTATRSGDVFFEYTNENTSTVVRNSLAADAPLGASDLLATFTKAAQFAADGKPLQVIYIGPGVDTTSELGTPALAEKIAALFRGADVHLSTVAVGSAFERPMLQALAGSLGGTFSRVEGAADVHAAVDQVFDGFYRPQLRNARVEILDLTAKNVHPENLGTLTAGTSAIVIGRFSGEDSTVARLYAARVRFRAETDVGPLERIYSVQLVTDTEHNQFVPRLWARAENESLSARMGLGNAAQDAALKNEITANAVKYQIMSPYTSFLILESEQDYARYGIKRTLKRVDWMETQQAGRKPQQAGNYWGLQNGRGANHYFFGGNRLGEMRGDSSFDMYTGADEGIDGTEPLSEFSERSSGVPLPGLVELQEAEQSSLGSEDFFQGLDPSVLYGDFGDLRGLGAPTGFAHGRADSDGDGLVDLAFDSPDPAEPGAVSGKKELALRQSVLRGGLENRKLGSLSAARAWNYGYRSGPVIYSPSNIFPGTETVDMKLAAPASESIHIDHPLNAPAYYQRVVVRDPKNWKARLHWVLALEADERYAQASKEFAPLLTAMPSSPPLHLEDAILKFHGKDTPGAIAALDTAISLSGEKDKLATRERTAEILGTNSQPALAADRLAELARAALKDVDALSFAQKACGYWDSLKLGEKSRALWNELSARFPDSPSIKGGRAQWLLRVDANNPGAALEMLKAAAEGSGDFAAQYVNALWNAKRKDEALAEARRFDDSAKNETQVYGILATLAQIKISHGVDEARRLLKARATPAQLGGAVRFWSAYSIKNDKDMARMIDATISRDDLPAGLRILAAWNLANYNAAGMTTERLGRFILPLLPQTLASDASTLHMLAQNLFTRKAYAETLAVAQAGMAKSGKDKQQVIADLSLVFWTLEELKRVPEFDPLYQTYAASDSTLTDAQLFPLESAIADHIAKEKRFDEALKIAERAKARFPSSLLLPQLYGGIRREAAVLKIDARLDTLAKLSQQYPADAVITELRARSLAQKGKLHEAADTLRAFLKAVPSAANERIQRERRSVLQLLSRICAQDAALREEFLKEAQAAIPAQNPVVREWTEAALNCMKEAGETEKYLSTLLIYTLTEPTDPEWAPRLGEALLEARKVPEALAVFDALSTADPLDAHAAFMCRTLALEQKDEKGAAKYLDRAFDALAGRPSKLQQFAVDHTHDRPEWALRAFARMAKDNPASSAGNAASRAAAANELGRPEEAIGWLFEGLTSNASYSLQELNALAQQERYWKPIDKQAREELARETEPGRQLLLHVLLADLKKLKQDAAGESQELNAAAKIELNRNDPGWWFTDVLIEHLARLDSDGVLEKYVLEGLPKLSTDERIQLGRSAISRLNNGSHSAVQLRLSRWVMSQDADSDVVRQMRREYIQLLKRENIAEAVAELHKIEPSADEWEVWNSYQEVVNTLNAQKDFERAIPTAFEMWERVKDSPNYNVYALREMSEVMVAAYRNKKLPPEARERFATDYLAYARNYFVAPEDNRPSFEHGALDKDDLSLRKTTDALAKDAENSGVVSRVTAAGNYWQSLGQYPEALRVFQRALALDPKNHTAAQGIYHAASNYTHDWTLALSTLDILAAMKQDSAAWLDTERVRCLEGLGRLDEAFKLGHTLLKKREFLAQGYWNVENFARQRQEAKDYPLAVEAWETSLRLLRVQPQYMQPANIAQAYIGCANAYSLSGQTGKALDCFLRGLSLIPRNDTNYKTLLDEALKSVLSGSTLEKAVAVHENNVATDGGDKPHLRLAFAEAFKRQNKTREMLAQLRFAADLLPKDMPLRAEVIDGYKKLGDVDAVIASYQSWAKLDPQNVELYKGWGDFYLALGRRDDALRAWATMAAVRPREAEGYRAYGEKLSALGDSNGAASALRQAVRYRPSEYEIAKELAAIYAKSAADDPRITALWTAGEAAARKGIEDLADDPAPWLNLGRFLEAQKRIPEAQELYRKIQAREWPRFGHETKQEAGTRLNAL